MNRVLMLLLTVVFGMPLRGMDRISNWASSAVEFVGLPSVRSRSNSQTMSVQTGVVEMSAGVPQNIVRFFKAIQKGNEQQVKAIFPGEEYLSRAIMIKDPAIDDKLALRIAAEGFLSCSQGQLMSYQNIISFLKTKGAVWEQQGNRELSGKDFPGAVDKDRLVELNRLIVDENKELISSFPSETSRPRSSSMDAIVSSQPPSPLKRTRSQSTIFACTSLSFLSDFSSSSLFQDDEGPLLPSASSRLEIVPSATSSPAVVSAVASASMLDNSANHEGEEAPSSPQEDPQPMPAVLSESSFSLPSLSARTSPPSIPRVSPVPSMAQIEDPSQDAQLILPVPSPASSSSFSLPSLSATTSPPSIPVVSPVPLIAQTEDPSQDAQSILPVSSPASSSSLPPFLPVITSSPSIPKVSPVPPSVSQRMLISPVVSQKSSSQFFSLNKMAVVAGLILGGLLVKKMLKKNQAKPVS